jgi:hypothetical protein
MNFHHFLKKKENFPRELSPISKSPRFDSNQVSSFKQDLSNFQTKKHPLKSNSREDFLFHEKNSPSNLPSRGNKPIENFSPISRDNKFQLYQNTQEKTLPKFPLQITSIHLI